ncbi:MupA/Atu3671 family FMN-dependent luciferase-like monooxygenase [Frankia sp. Cj5]|uniref:MupA/Atu3671 family FMN-dependent luciferase-like monooxygenase n=1 Tax=Frankia sp. Cj5 TaxID=2880978 RepID=UPI001EF5A6BB|nr:MupA/Atu3671 family FMN-dependent luciferase-like monooxygenase [Frankia sp. Cj5]
MRNRTQSCSSDTDGWSLLRDARELLAEQRLEINRLRTTPRQPIAVLGLGVRLPAGIETPTALWKFLRDGGDAIRPLPLDGEEAAWPLEGNDRAGAIAVRAAALVDDHDTFDPIYFRISPRESAAMDPQQRMILEVTDRAFQDAGVPLSVTADKRVGAYVSTSSDDYLLHSVDLRRRDLFDQYTGTGTARGVAAGRLGHVFGFRGPAVHVDTACSSSLVALHLACQALREGDCDLAVVAAANLIASPQNLLLRAALNAVAPRGRCRPFAADAEGFGQGEGALAVVLQPLDAALTAGRSPLAVIAGSAINGNGRGAGLTVPNGVAQREVIAAALRAAAVSPETVDLVEAHGTGTRLGDPIEVAALAQEFRSAGRIELGSVKSNFGHLEAAAGLLSLAKVLLCQENDAIAPTLHADTRNPEIAWGSIPFSVTGSLTQWPRRERPRRAVISSFGMAGTNAHVVVEDPPAPSAPAAVPAGTAHLLAISARTEPALRALAAEYGAILASADPTAFRDICATAAVGRDHHRCRLVVAATTPGEALEALRLWHTGIGCERAHAVGGDAPRRIIVEGAAAGALAGVTLQDACAALLPAGDYTLRVAADPTDGDGVAVVRVGRRDAHTGDARVDRVLAEIRDDLAALAAALYLLGADVDWSCLHRPGSYRRARLPAHPYDRRRMWLERASASVGRATAHGSSAERIPMTPAVVAAGGTTTRHRTPASIPAGTAATAVPPPAGEPVALIAGWVAELLGLAPDEVGLRQPLLEQGADSLVFVELVNRFETTFEVELVLRQLFEELLTVEALGEYVIANASAAARSSAAAPERAAVPSLRTDQGRAGYVRSLTETYTRQTSRSIAAHHEYLPVMCNNRRSSSEVRSETAAFAAPLRVVSSQGAHITDLDGNDYVDIAMGFGVNLFGHQAPFIVDAVRRQLVDGMQLGPESALAGDVARMIAGLTGTDRVLFCNSGTEAVMTMMRLVRAHQGPDRRTIALFRNSYHGHFDSTIVNQAGVHDVTAVPTAIGITPGLVEDVIVLPFADHRALDEVRRRGDHLAAVLVEPVQNRRPDIHPGEFLRELRDITTASGSLLAFDEILTGFRIHPGGAAAHFGVRPDIVSYAKIVGGGMPLGVVAGRADVMDRVDGGAGAATTPTTYTAGTYCRHPLAMAAAHAVLSEFRRDGGRIQTELNTRTDRMRAELNDRFAALGVPITVHNFGSFFRFAVNGNLSFVHQPLEMDYFNAAMLTKGIYIVEGGTCFLSTAHTDEDIDQIIEGATSSARELRDAGFFARDRAGERPPPARVPRSQAETRSSPPAPAAGPPVPHAVVAPRHAHDETAAAAPLSAADLGGVPGAGAAVPTLSLSFFGDYPGHADSRKFDVVSSAVQAADGHLHAVWLPERHFHSFGGLSPNPSVLAAFLAGTTSTIRIHAGSVVLPLHDPIRVAEDWATVDNLSHGRAGVAFASGWQRNDFVLAREPFDDRRAVMWRDLDTVRRLWRGETINASGGGVGAEVRIFPRPLQPELPVWIAALRSEQTFRAAGERGLSVLTNLVGQTHEQLRANIAVYRQARAAAGWPGPGHVTALVHTLMTADDSAVELARRPLGRYLGSSVDLLSAVLDSAERTVLQRLREDDRAYLLDRAVDRYLRHNAMIGDRDACLRTARRFGSLGVDEIACFVDFGVAATDLLAGVDLLVSARQAQPESSGAGGVVVPSRGRDAARLAPGQPELTTAAAQLPGGVGVDEVRAAVAAAAVAAVAEPSIRAFVERAGLPHLHLVDLTMIEDGAQARRIARRYEADYEPNDPGAEWELSLVTRRDVAPRLTAAVRSGPAGFSARDALDAVVLTLSGAPGPWPGDAGGIDAGGIDAGGIETDEVEAKLAVSANERLMWLACEAEPDTALACIVRTSLDLPAEVDIDALQEAVTATARRHQALRMTVEADGETLVVHRALAPVVGVVDLTALSESDRADELARWYDHDARQAFDVTGGPLWRVSVLRLGARRHRIVVAAHHIVYDGFSERILIKDLARAYGEAIGVPVDSPGQPVDFAAWRQRQVDTDGEADRRFWRAALSTIPDEPALPARDRPGLAGGRGSRLRSALTASTTAALRRAGAAAGCTPYATVLSCFVALLRESGRSAPVGVSVDPRDADGRSGLVGYFSNLVPLWVGPSGSGSAREAMPSVREALLTAREHAGLPFAEIARLGQPPRPAPGRRREAVPLIPACFNWDHVTPTDFAGALAETIPDPAGYVRFDLSLNVVETDGQPALTLEWDYAHDAFDETEVSALAARFAEIVDDLVTETDRTAPTDGTVHGRFRAVAARMPEQVAARDRSASITWRELDERSDAVAAGLLARRLPAGAVVPVIGSLSVHMVVALLSVLKAGAAFTVLPASSPDAVIDERVGACGAPLVIQLPEQPVARPEAVNLAELTLERFPGRAAPAVMPADAAYVITTSGSTGHPKPVVVEHRNLLTYIDALSERIDAAGMTCLVVTSPAYDLGFTVLFSVLTRGGMLLLADDETATDPYALEHLCAGNAVDLLKITPSHLEALLATPDTAVLPRRHLVLGGEVARWGLVRRVRAARPGVAIWNHYGPAETTVGATMYRVGEPDPWEDRSTVPIGVPINGSVHVAAVPGGEGEGELFISGSGVARGYLGLPAETDAAFVRLPAVDGGHARWYRTGDIVKRLPDGTLEFVGRRDGQVSVRGHRVELGAVDAALAAVPGVRAAAAASVGAGADSRLVAGAVLEDAIEPRNVLAALRDLVPAYQVPSALVALERLPVTVSGKIDRAAVGRLAERAAATVAVPGLPPADADADADPEPSNPLDGGRLSLERLDEMTGIWRGVLENDGVGPDDDFFDLGAHSIHAIKIVARVRHAFGRRVPIRVLFDVAPTPRALLQHVSADDPAANGTRAQ